MKTLENQIDIGTGRTAVRLQLVPVGGDLLLMLTGGRAHVGAVAVAVPGDGVPWVDLIEIGTHREGPLAREGANLICGHSNRTVTVTAGIHIDNATDDEIQEITANATLAFENMVEFLQVLKSQ